MYSIRLLADKNLWQLYQKDPTDPQSFTAPRSPWCLCNFPPCQNQTKCGLEAQCDNKGVDCSTADTSVYWNDHAPFPTSNTNALLDPVTGTVKVIFRGFNGEMYEQQHQLILEIHRSTRVVLCTQVSLSSVIINNASFVTVIFTDAHFFQILTTS